ncbi:hypothetical protein CAPTEDRAFT_198520 [Capitella teleta]|uniref:Apple domain-containing protein n=1 Tax=Capitella teleta TaxID=283909 RepID=R7TYU2_CAPTE|nr:hypothetical protein CAPTEDRAFT_198520 [Capitella teleta]|eukprot:ELT98894.1 hypothetical protein CAPTEDRAFT_198520 [Capitella teleta]
MSCAGSLEQSHCEGDECCGGKAEDGTETYSVYAVGGLDVVKQIRARIMKSILDNKVRWLTNGEEVVQGCSGKYRSHRSSMGDYVALSLPENSFRTFRGVTDVVDCQSKCNEHDQCRSITYFHQSSICTVNYVSSDQGMTVPSESPTTVMNRVCNYTVDLLTNNFELEMVTFQRLLTRGLPTSQQPLYNEDFELDLTNSNAEDSVKRNVLVNNAEQYQLTTESGFQEGFSESSSESESQSDREEESTSATGLKVKPSSDGDSGFSLSAALTANSGLSVFGIDRHVSTAVSSGLNHEMSRAFSGLRSRASKRSMSSTNSQSKRKSNVRTRGNFFNNGFHKTLRTDKSLSYEYTLTVPALHRGHISFFVAESPNILKWKATFRLNGHVKLSNGGHDREVHVSRLLRSKDRLFYAMGTIVYNRRTVIGKTVITNSAGVLVTNEEHLLQSQTTS